MAHLKQQISCLYDAEGQGLVEYALILLFVAIAVVAMLKAFGRFLSGLYTEIAGMFP